MKFDAFIQRNVDAIVDAWVTCAGEILLPLNTAESIADLRRHGLALVPEIAGDMQRSDNDIDPFASSHEVGAVAEIVEDAASAYSASRYAAGLSMEQLVHELCLLRSIVSSLWRQAGTTGEVSEAIDGIDRFSGVLDRILLRAVQEYRSKVAASRDIFLAMLGHDLRGPLHGIAMASSVLASPSLAESTRVQTAKRVAQATKIMEDLIRDLLDFTRSRLGIGIAVERSECNLQEACEEVLGMVQMGSPEREFSLRCVGDLRTQADRSRIRQVLSNVLNNAVQHGADNTPVALIATGAEDAITLTVSNFGEPIPWELARMIFEPLVQAPITTSDKGRRLKDSLGLGLFIAREIVHGHGGTITVQSSQDGETTFSIRLPRAVIERSRDHVEPQ
jgi:signal transduction histidine kinase